MDGDARTGVLEDQLDELRRRHVRELARAEQTGTERGSSAALVVIDGLDRALDDLGAAGAAFAAGFEMLRRTALAELARIGMESDYPLGDQFDPHRHEAVGHRPGEPEGRILHVVRRGWSAPHGMTRAAQVIVALPRVASADQVTCPHGRPDASQCMACFKARRGGWGDDTGTETRRRRPR